MEDTQSRLDQDVKYQRSLTAQVRKVEKYWDLHDDIYCPPIRKAKQNILTEHGIEFKQYMGKYLDESLSK